MSAVLSVALLFYTSWSLALVAVAVAPATSGVKTSEFERGCRDFRIKTIKKSSNAYAVQTPVTLNRP